MQPHWKEGDVMVEGGKIHYVRTGDGSKPPVVLAHGFSDNGMCWLPVALALEKEYDVILPDARGHGKSARVQPGEMIDGPADLAGFIRGLGLDRPVAGGHSMGGNVSGRLGERYPELVRGLILEDPAWFTPPPPPKAGEATPPPPPRHGDWLLDLKKLTLEQMMDRCHEQSPTWPEIELRPWAESKQEFDLQFLEADMGIRGDWRETAKALSCPTLLITAVHRKGAIITKADAKLAKELNDKIQVVYIPKAGHSIRRENFPAYMQAVTKFLAKVYK